MENFIAHNPEFAAQVMYAAFKLAIVILGIIGSIFTMLLGVIGFFLKKEIKTLNNSVVELFRELRKINHKMGVYDQVVDEHNHNHNYGRRQSDHVTRTDILQEDK